MKLVTLILGVGLSACSSLSNRTRGTEPSGESQTSDMSTPAGPDEPDEPDPSGDDGDEAELHYDWLGGGCIRSSELSRRLETVLGGEGAEGASGARTIREFGVRGGALLVGVGDAVVATPEGLAARLKQRESGRPGTLWAVECSNPKAPPTPFVQVPGADFGSAVSSPRGGSLVFESRDGLSTLDLDTRAVGAFVARPPGRVMIPSAWTVHGVIAEVQRAKVPFPDAALLESWVIDPSTPESRQERHWDRYTAIATLVRHADGTLYLGDGACEGPVREEPSRHALWRSTDLGETWTALPLGRNSSGTGVVAVVVDRQDPRLMAVLTRSCPRDLTWGELARGEQHAEVTEDVLGGEVFVTNDGGKRWSQLPPAAIFGDSGHTIAHRLWSPSGSARHLRVAHVETYDRDVPQGGFYEVASVHESHDGGRTWNEISEDEADMPYDEESFRSVEVGRVPGHLMLERSPRGLIRSDDALRVLFPPTKR